MGNNVLTYRVFNQSREELVIYSDRAFHLSSGKKIAFKTRPFLLEENDRIMCLYKTSGTEVCILIKDLTTPVDTPSERNDSYGNEIWNNSSRPLILTAEKHNARIDGYHIILPTTLLIKPGEKTALLVKWVIENRSDEFFVESKKDKHFVYLVKDNVRLYTFIENFSNSTIMVMSGDKVISVEPCKISMIKYATEIYLDYRPLNYFQTQLPSRSYVNDVCFFWKKDKTNAVLLRVEQQM